jgi:hypothetical protein
VEVEEVKDAEDVMVDEDWVDVEDDKLLDDEET